MKMIMIRSVCTAYCKCGLTKKKNCHVYPIATVKRLQLLLSKIKCFKVSIVDISF